MTQSECWELTLEQKFKLEILRIELFTVPTDILKDTLIQEYIRMIQMDIFYKQLIKEKWGLENESK